MKIVVNKKMSNAEYVFEFDKPDLKEAVYDASLFANLPDYCGECKNTEKEDGFKLDANRDREGNLYCNVVCNRCGAKAHLGTHKSGKSYFWKKFETYVPKEKNV
jgi:hypothetical protein